MKHAMVVLFICSSLLCSVQGQTTSTSITEGDLRAHIKYLASDELEGRGSGSDGNDKAARYIANEFKQYELKPAGDEGSYFQKFEFVSAVRMGENNRITLSTDDGGTITLTADEDFRPLGFSTNGMFSTTLVFAGYGISAPDQKYDDYQGLDVAGKVVIVLRNAPDGNNPHGDFGRHSALREKARTARDKGAVGIVVVTGPSDGSDDDLIKLTYDQSFSSSGIAAISMRRSVLDRLLKPSGKTTKSIQDSINSTKQPMTFPLSGSTIHMETEVLKTTRATSNILGLLEAAESSSTKEVLVLGAHMDHLGYGGPGSGALDPDTHGIHNGADDNASGTAALLELAQAFAHANLGLNRSLLFIAFSGEELGTLGSGYYVNHPAIPLSQTTAMINMDMVGRLEHQTLTIHGVGTSPLWKELLRTHNLELGRDSFQIKMVPDGFGPSDHSQFYGKDIPVLFFFTGTHNDYHKVSDDWDKINYAGEKQITDFIYSVVLDLENRTEKPSFTKTQTTSPMGGEGRSFSVTLGIIPDYGESEGMRVGGLRPHGPAEKAGIKPGDMILRMAGKPVMNIYDYMGVLGELSVGDKIEVEVKRNDEVIKLSAIMEKRQ